jgi:hypothetical protein
VAARIGTGSKSPTTTTATTPSASSVTGQLLPGKFLTLARVFSDLIWMLQRLDPLSSEEIRRAGGGRRRALEAGGGGG